MPSRPQTKTGTLKLSEVARHLVLPAGIVRSGYPAVRDQCSRMGIRHDTWQQGLGRAILAKRADGSYAAGIGGVVVSICRQVGKTFTLGSIIFALCVLFPGLKVLWTAHRTRTSSETFRSMKGMAQRKLVRPFVDHIRSVNGEQEIEFKNGSRILFGARESGFGRGFDDVDMIVFDEAQILTQKALDDMVPSTNVAVNPLILFIGTPPKPSDPSEVFTGFRARALAGTAEDMLFVEISADQGADPDDRAQWRKGNPSYPSRTPEAAILRMRRILGDESFLREGLGIWDEAATPGMIFPEWDAASEKTLKVTLTRPDGRVAVGLAMDIDRDWSSIVWAWRDGRRTAVDLVRKPGTDWVLPYLVERADRVSVVAVDQTGPAGTMLPALGAAKLPTQVVDTQAMKAACAELVDAVRYGKFIHRSYVEMDTAAALVKWRRVGDGNVFSRRDSGAPIDSLEAAALAAWGIDHAPKRRRFSVLDLNEVEL